MADFGYFQIQAMKRGLVLCMVCFRGKPPEQMLWDENGQPWDICQICKDTEDRDAERRAEQRRKNAEA